MNTIDHLRGQNPCPLESGGALFTTTADPASVRPASRPVRSRSLRTLVGVTLALAATGMTFAASQLTSPLEFFQHNPATQDDPHNPFRTENVVATTIRRAAVVRIPDYGVVTFWYGRTRQGGWCGALRRSDGSWLEASVTGCFPTPAQANGLGHPVYAINGFTLAPDVVIVASRGEVWRIYYGYVATRLRPAVVADLTTGRRVSVGRGGLFALATPDPTPSSDDDHLVAFDVHGRLVADSGWSHMPDLGAKTTLAP